MACRFWFYGDDPVEERLKKVGGVLAEFEARTDIESLVPVQALFTEPRNHVHNYAAGDDVRAHTLCASPLMLLGKRGIAALAENPREWFFGCGL